MGNLGSTEYFLEYVQYRDLDRDGMNPVALLRAFRPLQWIKNALIFVPFVFAVDIAWSTHDLDPVPQLLLELVLVALAFCALSSAIYLFNDLMDLSLIHI